MDRDTTLKAFKELFLADVQLDQSRTLEEYLALFPGHEDAIREAHGRLTADGALDESAGRFRGGMLGRYRILEEIGRGGQGEVYLAEDLRMERRVALKVLSRAGALSPSATARFEREARAVAGIDHPAICTVHEAGQADGVRYIAMAFVEGKSLARLIRESRDAGEAVVSLPGDGGETAERRVLAMAERVAHGLHAAHEAGLIHRDVKPGNVMVTPEGHPVLLDFGLAHGEDEEALTGTGAAGTPEYMSPEQIGLHRERTPLDRRTDVYSLGVTLYECLTLRRPFEGATAEALHRRILLTDAAPARRSNPALTRDVEVVVATALEKDRDRRYQSAADMADDLARCRAVRPIRARRAGPVVKTQRWAQRNPAVATLAMLVVALTVFAFWMVYSSARHQEQARARAEDALGEFHRLASITRLQDLEQEAESLWPTAPQNVAAMQEWLQRANRLVAALPAHRRELADLRARARQVDGTWRFTEPELQWRHDMLEELVSRLERLAAEDSGMAADVGRRLDMARSLQQRSIDEHRDAWRRVIAEVAKDPRYGGLELSPQMGLVPIGADPETRLQEFVHLMSGTTPERDAHGRLRAEPEHGIVLVLVPGGTFNMGAQRDDGTRPNFDPAAVEAEAPVHRVTLDAFFMAKYEMTRAQWQRLAGSAPPRAKADPSEPVENRSWEDARRVLIRFGLVLPTEAQWEYAARAGTTTPWWTGSAWDSIAGSANLADASAIPRLGPDVAYEKSIDDGRAHLGPVGGYRPNPFGLHDLMGNVAEWTADAHGSYTRESPRAGDGARPGSDDANRVIRGGSFRSSASGVRSAARQAASAGSRLPDVGIRPARPVIR